VKHAYYVIGDEDTVLGFRCAGIPGRSVATSADVLDGIEEARRAGAGILILTEEVADMARQEVDALRLSPGLPMLVEIPGPQGPLAGRRTLQSIIREAIGVKV
jgi:vacuolar-type H+-ATPase subunit F/Vma7